MPSQTPDIAQKSKSPISAPLEKVGMEEIEVPILIFPKGSKSPFKQLGKADAYVNLIKPEAKGIHMSRLFIRLHDELSSEPFTRNLAKSVLENFLESHSGLSDQAFFKISYEHPVTQNSLLSGGSSWRSFPVTYNFSLDKAGKFSCKLKFSVLYSSTCPCSAALSRQALQEKLKESFGERESSSVKLEELYEWVTKEENMAATPHSQRSKASLELDLQEDFDLDISDLVATVDEALKTSVQSIVKREDEKEFAKRNAQNLMFAEDAARRLKKMTSSLPHLNSASIKVCHYESLHAHNAVAYSAYP